MSTYMEIVEADDTNPNTIKEPAKRWRNWWKVTDVCPFRPDRYMGQVYASEKAWPSKEVAETKALDQISRLLFYQGHCPAEHLGAFPEGERP